MQQSYWEKLFWKDIDFAIIGSGIVGLTSALNIKQREKNAKVVILEKNPIFGGASVKNAGFACFGSSCELLDDLDDMSAEEVIQLIQWRFEGLNELQKWVKPSEMELVVNGNHELFNTTQDASFQKAQEKLGKLNQLVFEATKLKGCFYIDDVIKSHFYHVNHAIKNQYEGHLHTGKMMQQLLARCHQEKIHFLHGVALHSFEESKQKILLNTSIGEFKTNNLILATNAFSQKLIPALDVQPARAQVLITKPFNKLPFEGAFHMNSGYFYMRTINQRILFGGGRNLDFKGETTFSLETTQQIQEAIEKKLKYEILGPDIPFEIEHRWAGTMGVGKDRFPIIQAKSNLAMGVKLGGMGVAMGSLVGKKIAEMLLQ